MVATLLMPSPVEAGLDELAALAASCAHRPLVHALVLADLHRWHRLTPAERRAVLARARRRVDAVVPHPAFDFGMID